MKKRRLIDIPVEKEDEDFLYFEPYAEVLARFIMACETPITIGIQGDWGIGKTSLLNLVREKLRPVRGRSAKYHAVYFNTWQYSQFNQDAYLGLSILRGIMNEIQSLETIGNARDSQEFKQSVRAFSKFISTLGNQVIKKQLGLDIQEAIEKSGTDDSGDSDLVVLLSKTKTEFKKLVSSILENEEDKLVILIDDLDRIRPIRALEFLEAIKNFLDVEGCVFLIAVDYSVIQTGMLEKLGRTAQELQGKSYYDKIIQIPFSMPVSSYQIDNYIMSLLGWDWEEISKRYEKQSKDDFFLKIKDNSLSDENISYFTNITRLTVGSNPRSIKRAVNYSNLLKMVVEMKRKGSGNRWTLENAKMLFPLACMQLAYPELFQHFAEEPAPATIHRFQDFDYLSKLSNIDAMFSRVHNPDEVKSNITGFFDEFISMVDVDGDGNISSLEFKPIWEMMFEANLTNSKLTDLDASWREFRTLIRQNQGQKINEKQIQKVLDLFLLDNSKWRDPLKFKLLSAGKKFYNMIWDNRQVGSFVTTKKEPIQLYLKMGYNELVEHLSTDAMTFLTDVKNIGHYGTGDTKIDLIAIASGDKGIEILNQLHTAIVSSVSSVH